jgi:hypothetical protein
MCGACDVAGTGTDTCTGLPEQEPIHKDPENPVDPTQPPTEHSNGLPNDRNHPGREQTGDNSGIDGNRDQHGSPNGNGEDPAALHEGGGGDHDNNNNNGSPNGINEDQTDAGAPGPGRAAGPEPLQPHPLRHPHPHPRAHALAGGHVARI